MWHDQEFAGTEAFDALPVGVTVMHRDFAFDDHEQFVFDVVMVPDKLTIDLNELHMKVIEFADDLRVPRLAERIELLVQINFLHLNLPRLSLRPAILGSPTVRV